MTNVLFVCSQNRLRSPTAEVSFMDPELVRLLEARVPPHLQGLGGAGVA